MFQELLNDWLKYWEEKYHERIDMSQMLHAINFASWLDSRRLSTRAADDSEQNKPSIIFSGDYSEDMWESINEAKTKGDLRRALYFVCCRLQEFESEIEKTVYSNRSGRS